MSVGVEVAVPLSTKPQPPLPRLGRLNTPTGCRRELALIYAQARYGAMPWEHATKAAHVLHSIARMISGSEFEERLAALEAQAGQEGGR
jgi:hypothetical protein